MEDEEAFHIQFYSLHASIFNLEMHFFNFLASKCVARILLDFRKEIERVNK